MSIHLIDYLTIWLCLFYSPMHEVTPKVVAMAVSTVIRTCKILLQIRLFSLFMVGIVFS